MKKYNIEQYKEQESKDYYEREEAYLRAKKKVEKIVGFYWHLAVYIIVNCVIIWIVYKNVDSDFWSFPTFSTPIFWGIGLLFHFLNVFAKDFIFGKNWEQRKIEEFMEQEKNRWE